MILKTISKLAIEKKKTIVLTIHQPRSDIYQLFDDVLVITLGKIMYFGSGNEASSCMEQRGFPCPLG